MNDRIKLILLLDYYGSLLSSKQFKAMSSYYYEDLSLSEIADLDGISKQGVSDLISRAETKLLDIESDLHMLEKNQKLLTKLTELLDNLERVEKSKDMSLLSDNINYLKSIISNIGKEGE